MFKKVGKKVRSNADNRTDIEVICFIYLCQTIIHKRREVKRKPTIYI